MKIALITIHYVSNYGAVLQTFATKKILSQYGEVETINYFNPHLPYQLDLIRFKPSIHGIKMAIHDILRFKYRNRLINRFQEFFESNLNLSKVVTQQDINNGVINNSDVYVCGSDQIWNPHIVSRDGDIDPTYFLSFAPNKAKKISYASSASGYRFVGSKDEKKVKELLTDFTMISVRESSTQEDLSQLLKREIFHVLDPTLLLSQEEWLEALKIDKTYRSQEENYILVYRVPKDPLLTKAIKFFVKKLGLKLVIIEQAFKPFIAADFHIRDAGPLEFIELFANASLVITNSFHGTCFSINFKKPFVVVSGGGGRSESLLNLFGLTDRLISNEKNFDELTIDFEYEFTENRLKDERAKSIKILSSGIAS